MLRLRGGPAFSKYRLEKIAAVLRADVPDTLILDAEYWHFVDVESALDGREQRILERLLRYGPAPAGGRRASLLFLVIPRIGTVSPWSTKATDIARLCGLHKVRRVERGIAWYCVEGTEPTGRQRTAIERFAHDPMTENVVDHVEDAHALFRRAAPAPLSTIDVLTNGLSALRKANSALGLALSDEEMHYLIAHCRRDRRNLADVELMMFAQVNSEHCRHKIFNAEWIIDGEVQPSTLFGMICDTHRHQPVGTLVAYTDNAAIIEGRGSGRFMPDPATRRYRFVPESLPFVIKVETHNHPTAISPYPGAATGCGGEIRDEGAAGRGAKPKAGVTGFSVSHLRLPGLAQPWETREVRPARVASPLQIMLEGPIGAASFANEFGRPNVAGYFRTFEHRDANAHWGYHKPIMLAGGLGTIRPAHVHKERFPPGAPVVVLGGPAMLIGLGGGAASSMATGHSSAELDFGSVQRSNPEMQRRCQEVIDACCALGVDNPILSIHDVGAGGLSNALPELVHGAGCGGHFQLRAILNDDPGMSPLQIWCNEAQERYVLAISPTGMDVFEAICARERCLYSVIGSATERRRLRVDDAYFAYEDQDADSNARGAVPIDMDIDVLLGEPPRLVRDVEHIERDATPLDAAAIDVDQAVRRVLAFPAVADKTFLITIGDRSVTGLVHRDQMVGPWQVPVADAAVTVAGYDTRAGEAVAIGERTPAALLDPCASGRLAVGEAITNLACTDIACLSDIKLSANWMVAAGVPGQDAALFDTVRGVAQELCLALGISIPVGKDSMSMQTQWVDGRGDAQCVIAPLSLVITGFAPVGDVTKTLTPQLQRCDTETELVLIDLGQGRQRLGASVLAQTYGELGDGVPDVDDPAQLGALFRVVQSLNARGLVLAYHDRSDGGLLVTLCEMAFAGRVGLDVSLDALGGYPVAALFNEELGAVIQVMRDSLTEVENIAAAAGLGECCHAIGRVTQGDRIVIRARGAAYLDAERVELHRIWSETTSRMQALRDNPECARQEYDRLLDSNDPGIDPALTFDPNDDVSAPYLSRGAAPRVAILRDQGVNGHVEMAAAFHRAGFAAIDVTTQDIMTGAVRLDAFKGLVACGGFSFGDVLGAGQGWTKSILYHPRARDQFGAFLARTDGFALGVCNGCQMLASLTELIAGAELWPTFVRNHSEQFEARYVMVEIPDNPSIFLHGMIGSRIPVVVAHGEGRTEFADSSDLTMLCERRLVALRFVDHHGQATQTYPYNPNGSPRGVTGLTTPDGRVTIMMPHPERVFRSVTNSWYPRQWGEDGPWMRMFRNARAWVN